MKDLLCPAYTTYDCENLMHLYPHNVSPFCKTAKHLLSPSKGRTCEGKEPSGPEFALRK